MPFQNLWLASSVSLFEDPFAGGHVTAASNVAAGTSPSPAPTHTVSAVTLTPDRREIAALPWVSVSLLSFHLFFA